MPSDDFGLPKRILPVRQPIERSQGRSRRRKTPNYEKIRTRRPGSENGTEKTESFKPRQDAGNVTGKNTGQNRRLEVGKVSGRRRQREEELPASLNTKESRAVLDRIEPNQPKSYLQDGDGSYREIH